jgi:hypothetical protein
MNVDLCKKFLRTLEITDQGSLNKWMMSNHPDKIPNFRNLNFDLQKQFNDTFFQVRDCFDKVYGNQDQYDQYTQQTSPDYDDGDDEFYSSPHHKNRKADCLRKVENWSKVRPYHIFDSFQFDQELTKKDLPIVSPKIRALLDKIKYVDDSDLKVHGTYFKHFIFTDLQGKTHGSKIIASALLSEGYPSIIKDTSNMGINIDTIETMSVDNNTDQSSFGLISSSSVYQKAFTETNKKDILKVFNRPDNNYGQQMRIIIMDSKFKEGVDLFDVKYVHILEQPKSSADLTQVIGRATRYCGQKGLNFVQNEGWKIYVNIYKLYDEVHGSKKKFFYEKYKEALSINNMTFDEGVIMEQVEKLAMLASVDFELNREMHKKMLVDEVLEIEMKNVEGGGTVAAMDSLAEQMGKLTITDDGRNQQLIPTMSVAEIQKHVLNTYTKYKYGPIVIENACNISKDNNRLIKLTNTQKFVRDYLRPERHEKGLLLWHSVGTGKTCTAIAVKSHFEMASTNDGNKHMKEPFHVFWVTKTNLVGAETKNMYDSVCHAYIRDAIKKNPNLSKEELKELYSKNTKNLVIHSLSYRAFSNLLEEKNALGRSLANNDVLRKTLVIIDEAHKLYADDFTEQEKPDVGLITKKIHESYQKSKGDSCKVLLMTATPMVNGISSFVNLMNLIIEDPNKRFNEGQFLKKLNEGFTQGQTYFNKRVGGLISYLNRKHDPSLFAQPQIQTIEVKMSKVPEEKTYEACMKNSKAEYDLCVKQEKDRVDQYNSQYTDKAQANTGRVRAIDTEIKKNNTEINALQKQMELEEKNEDVKRKHKLQKLESVIKSTETEMNSLRTQIERLQANRRGLVVVPGQNGGGEASKKRPRAPESSDNNLSQKKRAVDMAQSKLQKCKEAYDKHINAMTEREKKYDGKKPQTLTMINKGNELKQRVQASQDAFNLCQVQFKEIQEIINATKATDKVASSSSSSSSIHTPIDQSVAMESDNTVAINQISDQIQKLSEKLISYQNENDLRKKQIEAGQIQYQNRKANQIENLRLKNQALTQEKNNIMTKMGNSKHNQTVKPDLSACTMRFNQAKTECTKKNKENELYQDIAFETCNSVSGGGRRGGLRHKTQKKNTKKNKDKVIKKRAKK